LIYGIKRGLFAVRQRYIISYNAEPHKSRSAVNQKTGLSGNAFLTEECRLRLVNKEKADWSSRVPGLFATFWPPKSW
jgi:hypothetical protein